MADISTNQMQLVNSVQFINRLQYLMSQYAKVVLNEAHTFPFHTARAYHATRVVQNPAAMAAAAAILISGENIAGAVIVGTVITDPITGLKDSSASDTALTNATVDLWNTLASIDTGV